MSDAAVSGPVVGDVTLELVEEVARDQLPPRSVSRMVRRGDVAFRSDRRPEAGSLGEVREILRQGPPFDLEATTLERHQVYLHRDELVFLFGVFTRMPHTPLA